MKIASFLIVHFVCPDATNAGELYRTVGAGWDGYHHQQIEASIGWDFGRLGVGINGVFIFSNAASEGAGPYSWITPELSFGLSGNTELIIRHNLVEIVLIRWTLGGGHYVQGGIMHWPGGGLATRGVFGAGLRF